MLRRQPPLRSHLPRQRRGRPRTDDRIARQKRNVPVLLKDADKLKAESRVMQEQAPSGRAVQCRFKKAQAETNSAMMHVLADNELAAKRSAKPDTSLYQIEDRSAARRLTSGRAFGMNRRIVDSRQLTFAAVPSDFRKLESGVRYIADSFSGTVVFVWRDKAYRID